MNRATELISLVIGLVVIVVVTALTINVIDADQQTTDYWEYDDYVIADDVSSVSGALEIVTVSGTQYIHANDVGNGTITYTDGSTKDIDVKKAHLEILFVMGQSNGEYLSQYAVPSDVDPKTEIGTAYYYGSATMPVVKNYDPSECAMHSMNDSDGSQLIGDIWPTLASSYHEITGQKVYVVSAAWGGMSIDEFDPSTGDIWTYSVNMITNSTAAIDTDYYDWSLRSYIWIQGEADENMPIGEYKSKFLVMHDAILNGDLGIDTISKCFISKVRTERAPVIAEAEIQLVAENKTIYMATQLADTFTYENGCRADYSHYTQKGDNMIGDAVGEYIAYNYYPSYRTNDTVDSLISTIPLFMIIVAVMAAAAFIIKK